MFTSVVTSAGLVLRREARKRIVRDATIILAARERCFITRECVPYLRILIFVVTRTVTPGRLLSVFVETNSYSCRSCPQSVILSNFGIACKLVVRWFGMAPSGGLEWLCPVVRNGSVRWFGMALSGGSEWLCPVVRNDSVRWFGMALSGGS